MLKSAPEFRDGYSTLVSECFIKDGTETTKLTDPSTLCRAHPNNFCKLFELAVLDQFSEKLEAVHADLLRDQGLPLIL